ARGPLDGAAALAVPVYPIPPAPRVDGTNRLVLWGETPTDDITFGDLSYHRAGYRELHHLQPLVVRVTDSAGQPLPARITVTDMDDELVQLYYAERELTAVRPGVVYTADGEATVEVPPGQYKVHATRGTEWSMGVVVVGVGPDAGAGASFQLAREVDTTGFVAADTHIHTLTHSGHGDSSVEERLVTLAGEGVELAIATDHNHNTDYAPTQDAMGLNDWFTPAVGNEVSTPVGHFNGFPLDPKDPVPLHDVSDVVAIVGDMRARGAGVVILNHPRWPNHEDSPHGHLDLDHDTGAWVGDWACPFDALELINSQTSELTPMLLFRDWFALLNRGERLFAVGSSDSHTVGGVVGQGRTYVASNTDEPTAIDVDAAAHAIANGHSSISMGIFVDARLPEADGGGSVMGEQLRPCQTELHVRAPSWVTPRRLRLLANGRELAVYELEDEDPGRAFGAIVRPSFDLDWPWHDFYMVAVVEGDGVGSKAWPQINDYTLAATNPIFFDVDGDGEWHSPNELAASLIEEHGAEWDTLAALFDGVDDAVAWQLLEQAEAIHAERLRSAVEQLEARLGSLGSWMRAEEQAKK
ncbi:MAG: CehA/McbA family metallohydrolase, partial [Planctomycetota bacterium]|nr:CehA/McbA family metallohydrolase [Planctomycetota bacterium]